MDISLDSVTQGVHRLCHQGLVEPILGRIVGDVVRALNSMHTAGAMHKNIEPANILLNKNGQIKLCGFSFGSVASLLSSGGGAPHQQQHQMSAVPSNLYYSAPERLQSNDDPSEVYQPKSDVWSLGITVVEVAQGELPFGGSAFRAIRAILENKDGQFRLEPKLGYSNQVQDFIDKW